MATIQFTQGQDSPPTPASRAKQLLPNIVDGMARTRPEAIYAQIPNSFTSYDSGYRKISYRDLANCVNGLAWLLTQQLGPGKDCETLAYVGPNDIGYVCMILAAVKAGYSTLSLSPRNTTADHVSLFSATRCSTLLILAAPYSATVDTILAGQQPRILHVPTVFQLLEKRYEHFPYLKTYEAAKDEPLVIVHTSGTTSTPKPMTYTHAFAASYTTWTQDAPPDGFENVVALIQSNRVFVSLPFFHAGCLYEALFDAITNQTTVVTPLAGVAPSTHNIIEALKHVDVDAIILAPPFMEQIASSNEMLELVTQKVRTVTYGGGDVSEACGNAFAAKFNVVSFNGSTETTTYPAIRSLKNHAIEDWKYIQPHPSANIVFRPTMNNLFEAVLLRNAEPERRQPVFTAFPGLEEYRTKDLWSPHPHKSELWMYRGRADDMIVYKSGYLCNPIPLEQDVSRLPGVRATLMVGTGRFQPALLIEPEEAQVAASAEKQRELIDWIWPSVVDANQVFTETSQIARSHILLTKPDLPFRRTGKGTVQRAPSIAVYKEQLDHLYESAGDGDANGNEGPYKNHLFMNGR